MAGGETKVRLDDRLDRNLRMVRQTFGPNSDLLIRQERLAQLDVAVLHVDGMVELDAIYRFLTAVVQHAAVENGLGRAARRWLLLRNCSAAVGETTEFMELGDVLQALSEGKAVILTDGVPRALAFEAVGWQSRGIEQPTSQAVVRGPQEGFTEAIRTNITLLRRRIKNPELQIEQIRLGSKTQTIVAMLYIRGSADEHMVQELCKRLKSVKLDGILESNYIEEWIQDAKHSLFPTVLSTERPDTASGGLLEGKAVILVDGTPYALIVPALFSQFMVSSEDYYHRSDFGLLRLLRYLALFICVFTPSIYIAVTTFHHEMIPTVLLVSIAAQREGVPFPAFVEALLMEVTFELLREAGIRMPKAVGSAISIVGALVVGQAAVEAGLVSAAMVIIVSITAISSFIIPSFEMGISLRVLRFLMMMFAASFGFFGIIMGGIGIVLHLCHLQSFGVPYMAPYAPFRKGEQQDAALRMPWWYSFALGRKMPREPGKEGN